jgi:hypothetical protein
MSTLPYYTWWDQLPDYLKTKTQLDQAGLKPGGPIRARIAYGRGRRARDYALYDQREAVAKKPPTPAQRAALDKAQLARRTCRECGRVVERPGLLSVRGRCWPCREAAATRRRTRELDATIGWARELMERDDVLILDAETTDLHGDLLEIGVIHPDGTVAFESLVNPEAPIAAEAERIHGISRDLVWNAPTFADIEPQLRQLLHGKTVIVYNADYDSGVLWNAVRRLCTLPNEARALLITTDWETGQRRDGTPYRVLRTIRDETWTSDRLANDQASWWIGRIDWQCAMLQYSCYVGEWHDYYHDYRYQPLWGGHRAVDDCRACLRVVQGMAATPLAIERRLRKPRARVYYLEES